jgi:CheY-like chemotaxis protein
MPSRPRTILLEDDDQMRQMLTLLLERRGHEVLAFSSPAACSIFLDPACQCPQQHPCADILITDLNMPIMNGLEFIHLQEQRGCKGMTENKLLLSANIDQKQVAQAQKLGCAVMRKPFRLTNLLAWIAEAENRIAADRQLAFLASA